MKNSIICTMLLLLTACQPKTEGFKISGTMIGGESDTIYLNRFVYSSLIPIDTAIANDGKFFFTGRLENPELCYIAVGPKNKSPRGILFVDNSQIAIQIDKEGSTLTVSGSPLHKQFSEAKEKIGANNLSLATYIEANPTSPVAAFLFLNNTDQFSSEEQRNMLCKFDTLLIKSHPYLIEMTQIIARNERIKEGQPAPDFTMADTTGQNLALSSLRGKYLLIDFWASWCGPCRRENPNVVKAYNKYKDKNFAILGVSLDNSKEKWLEAIKTDGLAWTQVSDLQGWENAAAQLYNIRSIPSNVLLDPDGKIIARNLFEKDLMNKLDEIFK